MTEANYMVIRTTPKWVLLQDVGPWDKHPTVTNDAEGVVEDIITRLVGICPKLRDVRIIYYDSEGQLGELKHQGTLFIGFGPATQEDISSCLG